MNEKKDVKREKVYQYKSLYVPKGSIRPQFIINAFKYKILYFNGEVLMFRNHWKYQKNFLTKELIVQPDDYFIEDEEGIIFKISSKEFEDNYIIVD